MLQMVDSATQSETRARENTTPGCRYNITCGQRRRYRQQEVILKFQMIGISVFSESNWLYNEEKKIKRSPVSQWMTISLSLLKFDRLVDR